jgi:hypothetical protein
MTQPTIPPTIAKIAPDGKLTLRQRRHILLQMALRRVQPGSGNSQDMADISRMVGWASDEDLQAVRDVVTHLFPPRQRRPGIDDLSRPTGKKPSRITLPDQHQQEFRNLPVNHGHAADYHQGNYQNAKRFAANFA